MKEWRNFILFILFFAGSLYALRNWRTHQIEQAAHASVARTDSLKADSMHRARQLYQTPYIPGKYDTTALLDMSTRILSALQKRDYTEVSRFVDPEIGLRFSPYAYVSDENVILSKAQLADPDTTRIYHWGNMDGSGDSILMNLNKYHKRFVCDRNYLEHGEVEFNTQKAHGNSLNNLAIFCPDCLPVSFFNKGSERYGGMDWKELKLVYRPVRGKWKLVALVHDEWTI